ncbi:MULTISPECIES: DNA-3-methyladenine glycosylase [Enterococcus]|uniref:DNA-3-methyladenine glycosylase n=1 Tax=Enterococcus TaxID=1350 RepID=UPI00249DF6C8|nr:MULTISPECIES: DNA-3-methyladenine glycosylase [Enterococcus]MDT2740155.1 DNA-3-methyladenine glycosylase [Enterococcus canintestini]WHA08944.1 DNA-3-methyladenine glycosylase [Enterococcus montenegrensis]
MSTLNEAQEIFNTKTTPEIAEYLIGMYVENVTPKGTTGGYIVDCEAYLGPEDEAAHSYGMRKTPRVRAMYEKAGSIYLYTMHTHLILNMVTQKSGIPQGVMIRGIEPAAGISLMQANRGGKYGPEISNGPGKLVAALGISKDLYGDSIFSSPLHLVPSKKREPKEILRLPRIGIPNKGKWTQMPLRYALAGNPYISQQKKAKITEDWGWK